MTDGQQATDPTATSRSTDTEPLSVDDAADLTASIVENVERVIVGQHDAIEDILVVALARGHLLLEDVPGVGKTMLARAIAASVDCSFKRVQFTPDLLPADVTGVNVFDQRTQEFEFQSGPVFANVVLADEINRAPPKTQAALLEAMEERQVTVDGDTRALPDPFVIIATQNDVEAGQTYELPMAEVDRFNKKLRLGYPDEAAETELLGRVTGDHPIQSLEAVADTEDLRRARQTVTEVDVREPVRNYVARLAAHTREHAELGVSPRGAIAVIQAAQARAVLDGRSFVTPDDVQGELQSVWAHRVRPGNRTSTGADVVAAARSATPVE